MKISLLFKWSHLRTTQLALVGALSVSGCGVDTIESARSHKEAEPQAPAPAQGSSTLGITDHGVPVPDKVDLGQNAPATQIDMSY